MTHVHSAPRTSLWVGLLLGALLFTACADDPRVPDQNYITCHELSCEAENKICDDRRAGRDAFCGDCVPGYTPSDGQCHRVCDDSEFAIHESLGTWICHKRKTCEDDEFISNPRPAFNEDHTCTKLTTCTETEFESHPPGPQADRTCHPLRTCPAGDYVANPGAKNQDRQCEPCPEGATSHEPNALECLPLIAPIECPDGQLATADGPNPCQLAYTQVSFGDGFACAVDIDQKLHCWGKNFDGQAQPPASLRVAKSPLNRSLALGQNHACALQEGSQSPVCWGSSGTTHIPESLADVSFSQIVTSANFACGIRTRDKTLHCWGYAAPETNPTHIAWAVAANPTQNNGLCYVETTHPGAIRCLGTNADTPDHIDGTSGATTPFNEVAHAGDFFCGIDAQGKIYCSDRTIVPAQDNNTSYRGLTAGNNLICAIRQDNGTTHCWGGRSASEYLLLPPDTQATHAAFGTYGGCLISSADQSLRCWGDDASALAPPTGRPVRQLHIGKIPFWAVTTGISWLDASDDLLSVTYTDSDGPYQQPTAPLKNQHPNALFHCAEKHDSSPPFCWIPFEYTDPSDVFGDPTKLLAIPPETDFSTLSLSFTGGCSLPPEDHKPLCWGEDLSGSLQPPDIPFREIQLQIAYGCGLTYDQGRPLCWGFDMEIAPDLDIDLGEIYADYPGLIEALLNPPDIPDLHGLTLSDLHACALDPSDRAHCWGYDEYAQATPPADAHFDSLSLGPDYSCGLHSDGNVSCWGNTTALPPPHLRFSALTQAGDTTCGILRDTQTEVCWGRYARNLTTSD